MMRTEGDGLRKGMMVDWRDDWDVPASCEIQVAVRFEMSMKIISVDLDVDMGEGEGEGAFLSMRSDVNIDFTATTPGDNRYRSFISFHFSSVQFFSILLFNATVSDQCFASTHIYPVHSIYQVVTP